MWFRADLRASFRFDIDILPFFECAERQAREVHADCSGLDLELVHRADRVHKAAMGSAKHRNRDWERAQADIVAVQAGIERLRTRLHLSATRSAVTLPVPVREGAESVLVDELWGFAQESTPIGVEAVAQAKAHVEQASSTVLEGMGKRAAALSDLVRADRDHLDALEARKLARQGRWLTLANVASALAGAWLAWLTLEAQRRLP